MSALRCVVSNRSLAHPVRKRFAASHTALRLVVAVSMSAADLALLYAEFPQWRGLGRMPTMRDYYATLPVLRDLPKGPMP